MRRPDVLSRYVAIAHRHLAAVGRSHFWPCPGGGRGSLPAASTAWLASDWPQWPVRASALNLSGWFDLSPAAVLPRDSNTHQTRAPHASGLAFFLELAPPQRVSGRVTCCSSRPLQLHYYILSLAASSPRAWSLILNR